MLINFFFQPLDLYFQYLKREEELQGLAWVWLLSLAELLIFPSLSAPDLFALQGRW